MSLRRPDSTTGAGKILARNLLSLMRHLHEDEVIPMGRELFIHRLARGGLCKRS
jgi:hypothetical protein